MGLARKASHRRRTLQLRLARGNIVAADARALVLGIFSNVDPSGAAGAVDVALGGAIREFTRRRMFSGQLGQVFVLPCARKPLRAEFVLFAGLGDFDTFSAHSQAFVAENVARTLALSSVGEFATVLLGAGSGVPVPAALEHQLRGFLAGLRHADPRAMVKCITVCELDARKYASMVRAARHSAEVLAGDDFAIEIDELDLTAASAVPEPRQSARPGVRTKVHDPVYLLVSLRPAGRGDVECRSSLLTAGAKAAVLSGTVEFAHRDLQRALAPLEDGSATARDLPRLGQQLARLLLAGSVREGLASMSARPLVVVHDREASRVPWETLHVGGAHPALVRGLSRRYESDSLTVARWRDSQPAEPRLKALLVANPTDDLPGAAAESRALCRMFTDGRLALEVLEGDAATRADVLARLANERYDVLHFAGHAYFDAAEPGRSGLLCAGDEILRGSDLARLASLPALVFCNACEAARVRRRAVRQALTLRRSASVAEGFLAGGVANFLGTHWPVSDHAALEFSTSLYRQLLLGASLGEAILVARNRVLDLGSLDWADYVHYGVAGFQLGNRDQQH